MIWNVEGHGRTTEELLSLTEVTARVHWWPDGRQLENTKDQCDESQLIQLTDDWWHMRYCTIGHPLDIMLNCAQVYFWCMVKPSKKLSLLLCVFFAFAGELPVRSHKQVVWRGQSSRWLNSTGVIRFTVQNLVTCSQRGVTRQFSVVCTEDSLCNVFYCDRSLFVLINVYWRRYDVWNVLKTTMRLQPINCNFKEIEKVQNSRLGRRSSRRLCLLAIRIGTGRMHQTMPQPGNKKSLPVSERNPDAEGNIRLDIYYILRKITTGKEKQKLAVFFHISPQARFLCMEGSCWQTKDQTAHSSYWTSNSMRCQVLLGDDL